MQTYGLLKVSGPDAKKLLQGQLTCDVEKLHANSHCLAALCNPQGRVISLFELHLIEGDYYLSMLESMLEITLKALKKYAVFYKVVLEKSTRGMTAAALFPSIYPETSGKFLPHELNLDQTSAIDFNKGCYTGQEIIARMHYRGKLKNRLYSFTLELPHPPLPGSEIAGGILVDAREKSYNIYDVLLITDEANAEHVKKTTNRSSSD